MLENSIHRRTTSENADGAFLATLADILEHGFSVDSVRTGADKVQHSSTELLGYLVQFYDVRDRIVWNSKWPLNLPVAVARFVWMMAASDRLADIQFYEPRVSAFTDNKISVPGSSYGMRILQPRPGSNQLSAIIDRLKADPTTRRAAVSIYQHEDAIRDSRDIPCAFGLMYHQRAGALHALTIMRSNNAFSLLPFNFFEFSLLAEVVAAELGIECGSINHFVASMHLFAPNLEDARTLVKTSTPRQGRRMPAMPSHPAPLAQITELVTLEAEMRHGSAKIDAVSIDEWIRKGGNRLHHYWHQLFLQLLVAVVRRNEDNDAYSTILSAVDEPYRHLLPDQLKSVQEKPLEPAVPGAMADLFGEARDQPANVVPLTQTRLNKSLLDRLRAHCANTGEHIDFEEFSRLQARVFEGRLAAKGFSDADLSEAEFRAALNRIRNPT